MDPGAFCFDPVKGNISSSIIVSENLTATGGASMIYKCSNGVAGSDPIVVIRKLEGRRHASHLHSSTSSDWRRDSCKIELKTSTCDIDAVQDDSTKCLDCVEAHQKKIDDDLVKNSKCTAVTMATFCDPAVVAEAARIEQVKQSPSSTCLQEVQQTCSGDELEGPKCISCLERHRNKVAAMPGSSGICSDYQLQHFCWYFGDGGESTAEVDASIAEAPCRAEFYKACGQRVLIGLECTKCILPLITGDAGKSLPSACQDFIYDTDLQQICYKQSRVSTAIAIRRGQKRSPMSAAAPAAGAAAAAAAAAAATAAAVAAGEVEVEIAVVAGSEASDSCRLELKLSTCDIDKVKGESTKCLGCAESHLISIDAGLVEGSTCTIAKLASFCLPIAPESFKAAKAAHPGWRIIKAMATRINSHGPDNNAGSVAATSDPDNNAGSVAATSDASVAPALLMSAVDAVDGTKCLDLIKLACGHKELEGPTCINCLKQATIPGCSSKQFQTFCFDSGGSTDNAQESAKVVEEQEPPPLVTAPVKAAPVEAASSMTGSNQPGWKPEVKLEVCRREVAAATCDIDSVKKVGAMACAACAVKHLMKKQPGSVCTLQSMAKICGSKIPGGLHLVGAAHGEQASNSCREEMKFSMCDVDAAKDESALCMSCVKAHRKKIDAGLVSGAKCTAAELDGFCRAQATSEPGAGKPVAAVIDKPAAATWATVVVAGTEASDSCWDELKRSTCGIDAVKDVDKCLGCVEAHKTKVDAKLIAGSKCTAVEMADFCKPGPGWTKIAVVAGSEASDSCRLELKLSTCDIDTVQHDPTKCARCVEQHLQKIEKGLAKGSKCTAKKLRSFCGEKGGSVAAGEVEIAVVAGSEASDSCRLELKLSTCDIDKVDEDLTKCLSCVENHKKKIEGGLVKGSKCTTVIMASFCDPAATSALMTGTRGQQLDSDVANAELQAGALKEAMGDSNGDVDDDVAGKEMNTKLRGEQKQAKAHANIGVQIVNTGSLQTPSPAPAGPSLASCKYEIKLKTCNIDPVAERPMSECISCAEKHLMKAKNKGVISQCTKDIL
jgi:sporulation-control protein spo0M